MLRNNSTFGGEGCLVANLGEGDLVLEGCSITESTTRSASGGIQSRLGSGQLILNRCDIANNFAGPVSGDGSAMPRLGDFGPYIVNVGSVERIANTTRQRPKRLAQQIGKWCGTERSHE